MAEHGSWRLFVPVLLSVAFLAACSDSGSGGASSSQESRTASAPAQVNPRPPMELAEARALCLKNLPRGLEEESSSGSTLGDVRLGEKLNGPLPAVWASLPDAHQVAVCVYARPGIDPNSAKDLLADRQGRTSVWVTTS